MNNSLVAFNNADICEVAPKDIPVAISNCFSSLMEVESKVKESCAAAKGALRKAKDASGKTINFIGWGTKDAVYALQSAVEAGALSQQTQQEVLDRILAFQQATAKGMKYLFQLGATGIAANRAVSKAIRDRMSELNNGNPSEFDEYIKAELLSTLTELKRQEDILIKQEKLNDVQKAMRKEMSAMNDELERRMADSERQKMELKRQADKDQEHDKELSRQARKDQEHDKELRRQADKDKEHDRELSRQAKKDQELDSKIEANAKGVGQNKENISINAKEIAQNAHRLDKVEKAFKELEIARWNRGLLMGKIALIASIASLLISIGCVIAMFK